MWIYVLGLLGKYQVIFMFDKWDVKISGNALEMPSPRCQRINSLSSVKVLVQGDMSLFLSSSSSTALCLSLPNEIMALLSSPQASPTLLATLLKSTFGQILQCSRSWVIKVSVAWFMDSDVDEGLGCCRFGGGNGVERWVKQWKKTLASARWSQRYMSAQKPSADFRRRRKECNCRLKHDKMLIVQVTRNLLLCFVQIFAISRYLNLEINVWSTCI